jgi:hypothetical protein
MWLGMVRVSTRCVTWLGIWHMLRRLCCCPAAGMLGLLFRGVAFSAAPANRHASRKGPGKAGLLSHLRGSVFFLRHGAGADSDRKTGCRMLLAGRCVGRNYEIIAPGRWLAQSSRWPGKVNMLRRVLYRLGISLGPCSGRKHGISREASLSRPRWVAGCGLLCGGWQCVRRRPVKMAGDGHPVCVGQNDFFARVRDQDKAPAAAALPHDRVPDSAIVSFLDSLQGTCQGFDLGHKHSAF